jgi:hypothetical protein
MANRVRMRNIFPFLFLFACSESATPWKPPALQPSIKSPEGSNQLPAAIRDRALGHIAAQRGLSTAWEGAALGRFDAIYRPDVEGPAYYEVEVLRGRAPAGSILLATGEHDKPIVRWTEEGGLSTDPLRMRARAVGREPARFVRVGFEMAAVTADGEAITSTLPAASSHASEWRKLEHRLLDHQEPAPDSYTQAIKSAWSGLAPPVVSGQNTHVLAPRLCDVGEAPLYDQLPPLAPGNTAPDNYSGCGATAWGTLIGWLDQRATWDPHWAPYSGLYRVGGAQNTTALDAVAPDTFDWGPRVMMDNIRRALGSLGWGAPFGNSTSTDVYQMGQIGYFLAPLGLDQHLRWPTYEIGGAPSDGLKPGAVAYLCDPDHPQPAVLGFTDWVGGEFIMHYGVATAYRVDNQGNETFRINTGLAGGGYPGANYESVVWMWPAVNFVGSLTQHSTPPQVPAPNGGIEILEATYGSRGYHFQLNNAAASVSAACNGALACDYLVDGAQFGAVQPAGAKEFFARYRCGGGSPITTTLDAEASGQSVHLVCPAQGFLSLLLFT